MCQTGAVAKFNERDLAPGLSATDLASVVIQMVRRELENTFNVLFEWDAVRQRGWLCEVAVFDVAEDFVAGSGGCVEARGCVRRRHETQFA